MRVLRILGLFAVVAGCGGGGKPALVAEAPIDGKSPDRTGEGSSHPLPITASEAAADAAMPAWYDPKAQLAALRPEVIPDVEATGEPLDAIPLYDLRMTVDPAESTFHLDERVYFQNRTNTPLSDVMMRMYANTPPGHDTAETLRGGHCVQTACTVETLGRDAIVVHLKKPLLQEGRLRIVLHVEGKLRKIDASKTTMMAAAMGSLKTMMPNTGETAHDDNGDYGLLATGDDILSFGNFYPVVARFHGGQWDLDESTVGDIGPDALSHVRMHVEVPADYVVAASGVRAHEEVTGGTKKIDFVAGAMRDFALLTSSEFTSSERDVDGVKVRSYYRKSDAETGAKVLDVAAWALKDFQKRFGKYPYRELEMVEEALVGGAGGVEFAGLATVASMFYKPSGSASGGGGGMEALLGGLLGAGGSNSPMKASATEFTTAHEVAHMWWHGAVGSDSRRHPWQDEALAQFSAMLYLEDRYGKERAQREGDMNVRMGYELMRMVGEPDGVADAPAGKQSQIVYGGLVYGKAPYFYVRLRKLLGDKLFFQALQAYVKVYYLAMAPSHAFVASAAALAGKKGPKVNALATRWLDQKHGDDDLGKSSFGDLVATAAGKKVKHHKGGGGGGGLPFGGPAGGDPMKQLMKMLSGDGDNVDPSKLLQQLMGGGGGDDGGDGMGQMMKQMMGN